MHGFARRLTALRVCWHVDRENQHSWYTVTVNVDKQLMFSHCRHKKLQHMRQRPVLSHYCPEWWLYSPSRPLFGFVSCFFVHNIWQRVDWKCHTWNCRTWNCKTWQILRHGMKTMKDWLIVATVESGYSSAMVNLLNLFCRIIRMLSLDQLSQLAAVWNLYLPIHSSRASFFRLGQLWS